MLPIFTALSRSLGNWQQASLLRGRLAQMSDRQLDDIGLVREDIRTFARLAMCDAPVSGGPPSVDLPKDPHRLVARAISLRSA